MNLNEVDILPILIGALIPLVFNFIIKVATNVSLNWMLVNSIRDLRRHLEVSRKSIEEITLNLNEDYPIYKVASRIRYCKYMNDSMFSENKAWIARKKSIVGIELLLRIRNYDIFLEEIINRVDSFSIDQSRQALKEIDINISHLRGYLDAHKLCITGDKSYFNMLRLLTLN